MLSDDDEAFLTGVHRSCELGAIGPDDPRYVSLEQYSGASGPDAVKFISRQIGRTARGSVFFLSGLRGSGKTTQLRRLRGELIAKDFAAVHLDAEQYLNLRQPVDIVEFLFFMAGGIADALEASGWLSDGDRVGRGWSRLKEWLGRLSNRVTLGADANLRLGGDFGLLAAEANLKAEIQRDDSFVTQLRTYMDGRLSELTTEANTIVESLVEDLKSVWKENDKKWAGLVVLVDSLDHVRGADFMAIRRALVELFDKQAGSITFRDCTTVFIVPPYLKPGYGTTRHLTNVKVTERDREPFETGIEALREIVTRRIPNGAVERLFPDDAQLRRVISMSGGNLRDLLRMVTEISTEAEFLPVDTPTIGSAIQHIRNNLLPISDDERASLVRVANEHKAPLGTQESWLELTSLFDRHLVLGYENGETWYDVHPLIRDEVVG
jgi:hypothetical protein